MKKLLLPILFGLLFASCSKSTTEGGGGLPNQNLFLNNVTFDDGVNPSLNGWIYGRSDVDSLARFSADVPPGSSAKWSLVLSPGWLPATEYVHRNFTGLSSGIYKLTLWGKIEGFKSGRGGVLISSKPSLPWQSTAFTAVTDTVWKQVTLLDTLTLSASDTTTIVLDGGSTELASWKVLYNNITFEKLP
ncbi:MAG: hypothetical protein ACHQM6_02590 [Candidatus Kapaibacterium sp.]